jgi:predicted dehydrogenase
LQPAFRLALIGAGLITESAHLPAALSCPGVEVVAIIDPSTERATALARTFGIAPTIATDLDHIAGGVDGVIIATPNNTHRTLAERCIAARIPMLIEKPLATSYTEGLGIVEAADAAGLTLAVGYCSRFRPNIEILKELLDASYFGRVRRFAHQFGTSGGWAPVSGYNLSKETAGGGVLVVTGTHFLDRMLLLWGFPDHAELFSDGFGGPEANCTAVFRYEGDVGPESGVARYSKTAGLPNGLVIETDRGVLGLADTDDAELRFWEHRSPAIEQIIRARSSSRKPVDVFQLQLRDFICACREQRPPRVDGRQGLESLRLLETLYANNHRLTESWYLNP